jgi:hypothetical protein
MLLSCFFLIATRFKYGLLCRVGCFVCAHVCAHPEKSSAGCHVQLSTEWLLWNSHLALRDPEVFLGAERKCAVTSPLTRDRTASPQDQGTSPASPPHQTHQSHHTCISTACIFADEELSGAFHFVLTLPGLFAHCFIHCSHAAGHIVHVSPAGRAKIHHGYSDKWLIPCILGW